MSHQSETPAPEFSRPVPLAEVRDVALRLDLVAEETERTALAERFGLQAVDSLRAEVTVGPLEGDRLLPVAGRVVAEVVQTCSVSLEPVPARVEEGFELVFDPAAETPAPAAELEVSLEEDEVEPLPAGGLDAGELVAEHLALGLEPYPRVPGVELGWRDKTDDGAGRPNPFAELAPLRDRLAGDDDTG